MVGDRTAHQFTVRGVCLLVVVFAAPLFLAGAYFLGTTRPMVWTHTGEADSSVGAISVEVDGWTYNIPLDVEWLDASGAWHESGRPDCLPPTNVTVPVTFGSIDLTDTNLGWRQVVWVACGADPLAKK